MSNSDCLITEYKEPKITKDKSQILNEQVSSMPKSYYKEGIIYEAIKQKSTPIRLKKTS